MCNFSFSLFFWNVFSLVSTLASITNNKASVAGVCGVQWLSRLLLLKFKCCESTIVLWTSWLFHSFFRSHCLEYPTLHWFAMNFHDSPLSEGETFLDLQPHILPFRLTVPLVLAARQHYPRLDHRLRHSRLPPTQQPQHPAQAARLHSGIRSGEYPVGRHPRLCPVRTAAVAFSGAKRLRGQVRVFFATRRIAARQNKGVCDFQGDRYELCLFMLGNDGFVVGDENNFLKMKFHFSIQLQKLQWKQVKARRLL